MWRSSRPSSQKRAPLYGSAFIASCWKLLNRDAAAKHWQGMVVYLGQAWDRQQPEIDASVPSADHEKLSSTIAQVVVAPEGVTLFPVERQAHT